MTDTLAIARRTLLETAQLDSGSIDRVLDGLMKPGVDAADLYFQQSLTETWSLEDGIVKSGANHAEQGVGVRACAGEKQGLAYSDALELPALIDAAQAAGAIVRQGQQGRVQAVAPRSAGALYPAIDPVGTLAVPDKLDLLQRADRAARAADSRVVQVMASLAANAETVLIACSDGTRSADVRPLVRMDVSVIPC